VYLEEYSPVDLVVVRIVLVDQLGIAPVEAASKWVAIPVNQQRVVVVVDQWVEELLVVVQTVGVLVEQPVVYSREDHY